MSVPKMKLVMAGESGSGKTALLNRIYCNRFEKTEVTLNASSLSVSIPYDGEEKEVTIWDTAGQERYQSISKLYYRQINGALVVFDLTSVSSFQAVKGIVACIRDGTENAPVIIIGSKRDLEEKRVVTAEEGRNCADLLNAMYAETSALTGEGVSELIWKIGQHIAFRLDGVVESTHIELDSRRTGYCC